MEARITKLETTSAVEEERHRGYTRRLDAIDGHLSWILKLLVGSILMALITFMLKGGMVL